MWRGDGGSTDGVDRILGSNEVSRKSGMSCCEADSKTVR